MIKKPNFLIIGSASRNVGKTELACRIINKYAGVFNITGLKISAVTIQKNISDSENRHYFSGDFEITEETDKQSGKDTARMLRAGASKTYRLKTVIEQMEKAVRAVLERIPNDTLVVCESTSVRNFIEPSVFLLITMKNNVSVKQSYEILFSLADRVIVFDQSDWNFSPDQVIAEKNQWRLAD